MKYDPETDEKSYLSLESSEYHSPSSPLYDRINEGTKQTDVFLDLDDRPDELSSAKSLDDLSSTVHQEVTVSENAETPVKLMKELSPVYQKIFLTEPATPTMETTGELRTAHYASVPITSANSTGTSPSSTCSSPDYRWPVASGATGGAAASPTSLGAEGPRPAYLSLLIDSGGSSPASSGMSPDYLRSECLEHDSLNKISRKRNRARPDPCYLANGSPRSSRYSSPEYAKSARRASPTPSTSPGGESISAKDSQQNRETHRRGRPRADQLAILIIEGSTSPSNIKCSICNRVFPREKSRQAHERIHRGDKPYMCDFPGCSRAFAQTGQLNTHQRLHTGEKPFLCSEPGCEVRFTHSNRHCPEHPTSMLIRSPLGALRPITDNVSPEVRDWLEKYNRAKNEKTPNSNKRPKSRKNSEIKTEQENLYGCKQVSSDNEDIDSQDEGVVSKNRRNMKSRKNLEMGSCTGSRNCYADDYNHNRQSCEAIESQDSQDESHDENPSSCLQSEEDEMQCVSSYNQSIDRLNDTQESDAVLKSDNEEAVEENFNVRDTTYMGIQPYQDEDFQTLPITPIRAFKDNTHEVPPSPDLHFEDEEMRSASPSLKICPVTPVRRSLPNERSSLKVCHVPPLRRFVPEERYSELDTTLDSETEEPSSTSVYQQLLVTPIRNYQNNESDSQDESSPLSLDQEPDTTTYQLPSTPVSRPSQCLPLKKRWGCMSTQHEAQNDNQNQPLAQPIRWDSSPFSNPGQISELHYSARWSLSCSQPSFLSTVSSSDNIAHDTYNLNNEPLEIQVDDALPRPNIEVQSDYPRSMYNIQVRNENRPSVLRHVGRINYDEPAELVVTDFQPLEQTAGEENVKSRYEYKVAEGEKHAVAALLYLGNQDSEGSHTEA